MDDNELDNLFGMNDGDKDNAESSMPEDEKSASSENESVDESKAGSRDESGSESDDDSMNDSGEDDSSESEAEDRKDDEPDDDAEVIAEEELTSDDEELMKAAYEAFASDEKRAGTRSEHKPKAAKKTVVVKEEIPSKSLREMIPLTNGGIAAVILSLCFLALVLCFVFLPAFRIRTVTIDGNVVLTKESILEEAGLRYDAHLMSGVSGNIFDILTLNYGKTCERIKRENPYIADIAISIRVPSEIKITVRERSKVAYVKIPDGYAALDRDGVVLEISSGSEKKNVRPVISGLEIKTATLGKKVSIRNEYDYRKALVILGAILNADNASISGDYNLFENTSELRVLPSGYFFLSVYSPSGKMMDIKLNSLEKINDHMAWLLYAANSNAFDKINVSGSIDMTGDGYIFNEAGYQKKD